MKRRHILDITARYLASIALILLFPVTNFAQSPQAFKYQAVIRNSAGAPVVSTLIGLRISILQDSATGIPVFVETQTATSNVNGLVSLNIGYGTPVSGILDSVKWKNGPFFLQVEADINGGTNYQLFGSSAILGAPYALYALSGNPGPKGDPGTSSWIDGINQVTTGNRVGIGEPNPISRLDIRQDSTSTDTILFEVKDKSGQPIFAVLESGVRVYVKPGSKGSRGGFSVGGRPSSKAAADDLLWVTSDSIRMYINTSAAKGAKGGFAVGGRPPGKGAIENFTVLTPENYLIGQGAGRSLTTGTQNAFLGYRAGQNTDIGSQNVFLGHYAGFSNDTGSSNIFIGDSAGFYNKNGNFNVFLGTTAGRSNNIGFQNIVLGIAAGYSLQGGNRNIFIGSNAGYSTTEGLNNVFIGNFTGELNTTGSFNAFLGRNAGLNNTTGNRNVFLGHRAGYSNTTGSTNIFIGDMSGYYSDSSNFNIFMGQYSGTYCKNSTSNVYIGIYSGYSNINGSNNVYMGAQSGQYSNTGSYNTFLGMASGTYSSGSSNVYIGNFAGNSSSAGSGNVYLGTGTGFNATGSNNVFIGANCAANETGSSLLYISNYTADKSNALIYGEFNNKILTINGKLGIGITPAYAIDLPNTANAAGQGRANAWNTYSDRRLKDHISTITGATDIIDQLNGVNFNWKDSSTPSSGFIAQEVEMIVPSLVQTDKNGYKSMDYSRLTPYLVNAFKEQQQVIINQQSRIEQQEKSITKLMEENLNIKQQLQEIHQLKMELNKLREEVTFSSAK